MTVGKMVVIAMATETWLWHQFTAVSVYLLRRWECAVISCISEGMAILRVRCTTCLELRHRDLQRHLYLSTMMYRNEYDGHFVSRLSGIPIAAWADWWTGVTWGWFFSIAAILSVWYQKEMQHVFGDFLSCCQGQCWGWIWRLWHCVIIVFCDLFRHTRARRKWIGF